MDYIWAFPPQSYKCRHVDMAKSKPWVDGDGILQNEQSLAYWTPTAEYITDLTHFQTLLDAVTKTEFTVSDSGGNELVKFWVEDGETGSQDGILGLRYSPFLLAFRPRSDNLIGLESVNGDTRLATVEKEETPTLYPPQVEGTSYEEAHFNEPESVFTIV